MKFTLALPLLCAAVAVGPAAAADATLRTKTKITDDAASTFHRNLEEADTAEMSKGDDETCATSPSIGGFMQALVSKRLAIDIKNFFVPHDLWYCGEGGRRLEEEPTKEGDGSPSTAGLYYGSIKAKDLRDSLARFPTLEVYHDAVPGNDNDCITFYDFAGALNSLFEGSTCKEFEAFLEKGEEIHAAVGRDGYQSHFLNLYYD